MSSARPGGWRLTRAEGLYALAYLGVHLAFMPLLVLLLPRRVEALGDPGEAGTLSLLLLAGGVAASVFHLVAGHWSDRLYHRTGNRRPLILIGLAALAGAYAGLAFARQLPALILAFLAFQAALNLAFAPLGALLADYVPDRRKGRLAGLMNAALPLSTIGVTLIAWLFPTDGPEGFLLILALVLPLMLPLTLLWPFAPGSNRPAADHPEIRPVPGAADAAMLSRDFRLAWLARLLVQLGAALVIGYFYLFLAALGADGDGTSGRSASALLGLVSLPTTVLACGASLIGGWLSDRWRVRRLPLGLAALMAALALAVLAGASSLPALLGAYALFHAGLAGFLAIDTALVAQLVSGLAQRGAMLGVMNLTNTLPSIVMPTLALAILNGQPPVAALQTLFALAALGTALAAMLVTRIRTVR